ncbi:FMN-dependent NADH-azoreductase [Achromobacter pestifer]
MTLLHIDSSPMYERSESRWLSASVVQAILARHKDLSVQYRDLAADPIPHLTEPAFLASRAPLEALSDEQRVHRQRFETLVDELLAAQIVVIGLPMYNLGIPSQLKSWLDHIAVPGRTFRYTERGIVGLIKGLRVVLASSRGGIYSQAERRHLDFQESYMEAVLGMLGITDIQTVRVEGVNMGSESRAQARSAATSAINDMFCTAIPGM